MYEDKTLVCKECGNEFVFTAGEQEFYAEKGFVNEPQRCKACRQARKNAAKPARELLKQPAQSAAVLQRFLSSQWKASLTTAAIALQRESNNRQTYIYYSDFKRHCFKTNIVCIFFKL